MDDLSQFLKELKGAI